MAGNTPSRALPKGYKLGEYQIESVLGIGGFGITYKAKDTALSSVVAIKEYFPQAFASRSQDQTQTIRPKASGYDNYQWGLQEFLKEARALAKFKHNYIVRVLRFMEANGTAYMIMEYEAGESLGDLLKRNGGYLKEADLLKVFLPVLSGLQAVHDAGLLHLDIKPDNIYLRTDGTPMLIDFGSVRQTKNENADQRVALTPAYSALEQYPSINREPGPWSDVYSMGATIYTCIVGKPPTDVMKRYDTLKRKYPDPLVPATKFERPLYAKHIRETVVHALQLDPSKRPQSAQALQRALMGQSLEEAEQVKKPTAAFNSGFIGIRKAQVQTEVKKSRSFVEKLLLTLLIVPALLVFIVQILIKTDVLTEEQVYSHTEKLWSRTTEVASATEEELKRTLRLDDTPSVYEQTPILSAAQMRERKKNLPPFPLQRSLAQTFSGHKSIVTKLAFLPNGKVLASISADGVLNLWNIDSGQKIKSLATQGDSFGAFALSNDGSILAKTGPANSIVLYNLVENRALATLKGHSDHINQVVFSPDDAYLVSVGDDKTLVLWDVKTAKIFTQTNNFEDSVLSADFSPGGSLLVTGDGTGAVKHWSNPSIKELVKIQGNKVNEEVTSVVFSPNGKWIATAGSAGFLKLWTTDLNESDKDLSGGLANVYAAEFSPDGKYIVAAGTGKLVKVWSVADASAQPPIDAQTTSIYSLAISHDGSWLATAGEDKQIRLWKAAVTATQSEATQQ